jgi:lipoyl(octanoyl) transferase
MIVPCGIPDKQVTSLARELGREVDMSEVKDKLAKHFEEVFQVSLQEWKAKG